MKNIILTLAGFSCALVLAGCVGDRVDRVPGNVAKIPQLTHPREITNPDLPLASLERVLTENKNERVERTGRPDVHKVFQIGGQMIEALTVEDREFTAGGGEVVRGAGGGKRHTS